MFYDQPDTPAKEHKRWPETKKQKFSEGQNVRQGITRGEIKKSAQPSPRTTKVAKRGHAHPPRKASPARRMHGLQQCIPYIRGRQWSKAALCRSLYTRTHTRVRISIRDIWVRTEQTQTGGCLTSKRSIVSGKSKKQPQKNRPEPYQTNPTTNKMHQQRQQQQQTDATRRMTPSRRHTTQGAEASRFTYGAAVHRRAKHANIQ